MAAGDIESQRDEVRALLVGCDVVIAVDGGLDHCSALGVVPDVAVGDFDSVSTTALARAADQGVEIVRHMAAKDQTDLELGLELAQKRGVNCITAFAVFGGRIDHQIGALTALANPGLKPVRVSAWSSSRALHVVHGGSVIDLAFPIGTTLSLLAWAGDAHGVATIGLEWPLRSETLTASAARGVSNVVADTTQQIGVTSGTLLVIVDQTELTKPNR